MEEVIGAYYHHSVEGRVLKQLYYRAVRLLCIVNRMVML